MARIVGFTGKSPVETEGEMSAYKGLTPCENREAANHTGFTAMQQQAMAQGILARPELRRRKLRVALARLESGGFGSCCQCGVELEPERLRHDPSVVFCADCVAEREAGA